MLTSRFLVVLDHSASYCPLIPLQLVLALGLAMFAAGMVHRVCVTVCLILSILATYFINRLSLSKYAVPVIAAGAEAEGLKKKKKK